MLFPCKCLRIGFLEEKIAYMIFKKKCQKFLDSKFATLFIQALILISVFQISLETLPSLKNDLRVLWDVLEFLFLFLFSIEYLIRLYSSDQRLKFAFSFYGVIDLLAIMPSMLSLGLVDLRFIRSLRLLRIFRILKFARHSTALNRLKNALDDIKDELLVFSVLSFILLFITASGIYYFEHEAQPDVFSSIPHSLWWAVATLTTVGYGDVYPITVGGKIFTFFILLIGLGIISVPSGLFASALSKTTNKN